jgi:hypothetical protein
MGQLLAWWLGFALTCAVGCCGILLTARGRDQHHSTGFEVHGNKFHTTSLGLGLIGVGLIALLTMLSIYPEPAHPVPVDNAGTNVSLSQSPVPPAHPPGVETPPYASTAIHPPVTAQPDPACASSGPWSAKMDGLQIVVPEVHNPQSRRLVFTLRIENYTDDGINIERSNVLAIDNNGKQYEVDGDEIGLVGLYVQSNQVHATTISLATPLEGAPDSLQLRFNIDLRGYRNLSLCVPIPPN